MPEAKIMHFIRRGIPINGVIHVGTNWGEEFWYYEQMGIQNMIGFEPLPNAFAECLEKNAGLIGSGRLQMFNYGLGSKNTTMTIKEVGNNTGGSSFLEDITPHPDGTPITKIRLPVKTFEQFVKENPEIDLGRYDCLVIDVQGMELDVLRGMGDLLRNFKSFNIECSETPVYKGEASAQEVIDYLKGYGIRQDSPIYSHDDIMFIREG